MGRLAGVSALPGWDAGNARCRPPLSRCSTLAFWKERIVGVYLLRSWPYQKNDKRLVEQKDDTLVRQCFGQLRLDTPAHIEDMNALYERMWLYYNLFQPVLHFCEKLVVNDKVRRKWDQAQTLWRLQATGKLCAEQQRRLQALRADQSTPLTPADLSTVSTGVGANDAGLHSCCLNTSQKGDRSCR